MAKRPDPDPRAYRWYLIGCHILEWPMLRPDEFWPQYRRYTRGQRFLQRVLDWQAAAPECRAPRLQAGSGLCGRVFLSVLREMHPLIFVGVAVEAGRCGFKDDDGSAPMPAGLRPKPPPHPDQAIRYAPSS